MTSIAIFMPLLAAWAALSLAARRPGWGYVGKPLSPAAVVIRAFARGVDDMTVALGRALLPALRSAIEATERLTVTLKHGVVNEDVAREWLELEP